MSDNDQDKKFKEELEKELESGLHLNVGGSSDGSDGNDFTVKVRREEYIVKRRFYDKDKALEAAETLRKDKRNLVEDNIEGQAFAADDDGDEKVDWDKLVDAGLVFDPPIAQAAEKHPDEPPVGLADLTPPKKVLTDKELEKTLLVKRPRREAAPEPEDEIEENVEFEGEEEDASVESQGKSKTPWVLLLLVVLVVAGGAYYYFAQYSPGKTSKEPKVVTQKIKTAPVPERTAIKTVEKKQPVTPVADEVKAPPKVVETPAQTVPKEVQKPVEAVVEKQPEKPKAVPEPAQVSYDIEDHFTHTVHVSSYREQERARAAVNQLNKKGFMAFTGVISIPGKGEWYRVYAGYMKDLDTAKTMASQIKKDFREDAVARKAVLAIQVGDTAPSNQIGQLLTRLDKKGYSVNAVPVAPKSNVVRILTGAFKTEAEAATMVSFLKRDGFSAKVVER